MFDTVKSADGLKVCRKYPIKFRSLFSNKLESSDLTWRSSSFSGQGGHLVSHSIPTKLTLTSHFEPDGLNAACVARWYSFETSGWLTPLCLACRAGLGPQVSHRCRRWWNPSPSAWPWSSGCLLPVGGSVWCLKDFKWGNATRCRRVRQQCFPH